MGKVKHQKASHGTQNSQGHKRKGQDIKRRQHSQNGKFNQSTKHRHVNANVEKNKKHPLKAKVPFTRHDRVLLVGEGDFSFALSLATHYETGSIVATSYDDVKTLKSKYPAIETTLQRLARAKLTESDINLDEDELVLDDDEWNGFSPQPEQNETSDSKLFLRQSRNVTVLHGVDATSLSKLHKKTLSSHAPFTKIVFNFPHTGGISTDVNRQVRANQELLVKFFNAAKPLLATRHRPAKPVMHDHVNQDEEDFDVEDGTPKNDNGDETRESGRIIVTLFEGEPYTLWNIRDLARHCGLQVVESFKFGWSTYPGYQHARTLGDITTGKDRSHEGKRKGAWRGEERDARCYVLALQDELVGNTKVQRKRRNSGSDESE